MVRALMYLLLAGAVWLAEGLIFAHILSFALWQTILIAAIYVALWGVAARHLIQSVRRVSQPDELPEWRYLSLAPILVVVLGSFASLPILLLIVALGKLG